MDLQIQRAQSTLEQARITHSLGPFLGPSECGEKQKRGLSLRIAQAVIFNLSNSERESGRLGGPSHSPSSLILSHFHRLWAHARFLSCSHSDYFSLPSGFRKPIAALHVFSSDVAGGRLGVACIAPHRIDRWWSPSRARVLRVKTALIAQLPRSPLDCLEQSSRSARSGVNLRDQVLAA
jgi:hypothetical protein